MIVGLGVDIAEIDRIRRVVSGPSGDRFVARVYTPAESAYCRRHRDSAPHFAARFAAKEAVFKALGTGWGHGVRWRDVEVTRARGAAPNLVLYGRALERSRALGAARLHVTLTHSENAAAAFVILES